MAIIKAFAFTPEPTTDAKGKVIRIVTRPLIRIRLEYGRNKSESPVTCLLDSGCDFNLFPASWGKVIGIDITKGKSSNYEGIGKSDLIAYTHIVKIHVEETKISFTAPIDFSEKQQLPLLGRAGFFSYFKKVIFDELNDKFILQF